MNNQKIYTNIINKIIKNKIAVPYILHETDTDIDIIKEYDVFTDEELNALNNYDFKNKELTNIYLNHPQVNEINVRIPNDVKEALKFLQEQGYSKEGICYDVECENCFDYDADITINDWLNDDNIKIIYDIESSPTFDPYEYTKLNKWLTDFNKEGEKSFKITKLYEYMLNQKNNI